ncbi:hypothetical protein [Sphaerimonospora mesophila]|uniref:hypothetical protein n=1 Tax=Sphaerimonospora mesophila TaxID=37483 RepID=UPI0006E391ED
MPAVITGGCEARAMVVSIVVQVAAGLPEQIGQKVRPVARAGGPARQFVQVSPGDLQFDDPTPAPVTGRGHIPGRAGVCCRVGLTR